MKIGFDATKAFAGPSTHGNYSKSVIHILSQNHPEDHYILYTSKTSKNISIQNLLSPPHVEVRTPAYIVSRMKMGNIWRSTILGNTALKDEVDVFHGLSGELPIIISKRLKTIVTIHNLNFIRYPHLYNSFDIEILRRKYKHACKVANKIIATSKQTAEDITAFLGVPETKIQVIYQNCHAAFKKEYTPFELRRLCDQYNLPDDFILITSQNDIFDNNILMTLKALALIKDKVDIPLVIAGEMHKRYAPDFFSIAAKEQISNRIIRLETVPTPDLAKIYQICKLYVYAATYPCSLTSITEALYSKVPVICSRIPEFIETGGLAPIYIQPGNEEELSYTIQNVLNNPSLASNMISQGEFQVQQFEDEVIANKLNRLYTSLVQDKID